MSLGLVNAANARDLGGHVSADGRRVRHRVLYRADALHRLTEADVTAVGALRLASLIDFRHPHEVELVGPDRLPEPPPRRVVSLPLFNAEHDVFTTVTAVLNGAGGEASVTALRDGGPVLAMRELYRWFVEAPVARQVFGAALRLIADEDALPLLFHCTAGKDRTGWLATLVLSALGVDRAAVTDDYLRTNDLNASNIAYVLATLAGRIDDPGLLIPLLQARHEYLDEAFAAAERRYGSIEGYLTGGLGLEPEILDRLRANLLE
ncbi:MAG: tyrosine-protein phosphatase [Micromonosporaceae bacterium]